MTDQALTARIEVFRPGTFTPMKGAPITYSAADLKAIADAYDPEAAPAPVVVGHPDADAPAFGWVEQFEYDADGGRLYATLHQIDPTFAEAVKRGSYKKVSMAFFSPDQSHNPVPGTWYPKHVGFLGAAAPAVSGLKPVRFSADAPAGAVFTASFGERGFEETASILRMLRDFFIEKFGLDEADKVLPAYRLEWLSEAEVSGTRSPDAAYAAAATLPTDPQPTKEPAVSLQPDPAFAAREASLTEREAALAARELEIAHADNVAFAEGLVADGRLVPASKDKVVALLDALPDEQVVAFAEGEAKLTPAAAVRALFEAQPKVVTYGRADLGDAGEGAGRVAAFAADGKVVDPAGLERHNKALAYQRLHPGTDYLAAVRAVA